MFVDNLGFADWQSIAAFPLVSIGFYAGRISDGVRGTFFQKAMRGWHYLGIPIGLYLLLGSPWILIPCLFFWQGGLIHWLSHRVLGDEVDYVARAEIIDGYIRGAIQLVALCLAAAHGA